MPNKILIVDDEPSMLDLLEQQLTGSDYTVERASNGEEGLKKVELCMPDVILLDYIMPEMNGLEVLKRLKDDSRYQDIPVILLTAVGFDEDVAKGLDSGADDYIIKPVRKVVLLSRLRSVLRIKRAYDLLAGWNRSLADQVRQQVEDIGRMGRLKRYLSPQIAEAILKSKDDDLFATHRREITVVFLDLRGFTAFSDNADPEEVIMLLRNYQAEMGKVIFKYEGTLAGFAGDGIMVFFNDPIPCDGHTEKAARMALEMLARAKELRGGWLKKAYNLDLGVGLAAGFATLGNIGFEGRMDYGAVGNVTNLAARLCEEAEGGQILTDRRTLSKIEDLVEAEPLQELLLKGIGQPVSAFNILKLKCEEFPNSNRERTSDF
jgi:class 3 adenylate cyclase/CheY-like chemotaxis protein